MTVSRDYENVGKLFANVLASKEEQYVKHVTPFMTHVANRLQNSFTEYVGKPLTAEKRKELVEKCEGILREIFLGKPITEVTVSGSGYQSIPDFKVLRELKAKRNRLMNFAKDSKKSEPKKSIKSFKPINIPTAIHASWRSIVDNGQDYND